MSKENFQNLKQIGLGAKTLEIARRDEIGLGRLASKVIFLVLYRMFLLDVVVYKCGVCNPCV